LGVRGFLEEVVGELDRADVGEGFEFVALLVGLVAAAVALVEIPLGLRPIGQENVELAGTVARSNRR